MFGINGAEVLVLLLIVVVVVGPQRLPEFAEQLAGWVRTLRTFIRETRDRVTDELSASGAEVDWESLDPRRYDPRRIVREALLDDATPARGVGRAHAAPVAAAAAAHAAWTSDTDGERPVPPFDPDLT